jgi:hypothetical protein
MAIQLKPLIFGYFGFFLSSFRDRIFTTGRYSLFWGLCCTVFLTSCSLPQVSAESRLFLDLSLTYLAEYQLPQTEFKGTTVGGFSSLTYDRSRDRIYALAGDRFYTLALTPPNPSRPVIKTIAVEAVTPLIEPDTSSPIVEKGIALTPRGTVFIQGEQNLSSALPRLSEFQLTSGDWQQNLPLPKQYGGMLEDNEPPLGVQPHQGLKALAINMEGDRLFTATEAPLTQDLPSSPEAPRYSRLLHYWIAEPEPLLISEHLYPLEISSKDRKESSLTEIVPLDSAGHFLGLERTYSPVGGYSATVYQFVTGVATDTSQIRTLSGNPTGIAPIMKKKLLNLDNLQIPLQNLEGMILGPHLADGSESVVLASNNVFLADSPTQFLLLRLAKNAT